jgi:hypothetical protein
MAVDEAAAKTAAGEAAMKIADQGAAGVKATVESVGSGSGSSPTPAVGTKRAVASGGSTPPSKWFCCAWKPRYAEQLLSLFFLFIYTRLHCI